MLKRFKIRKSRPKQEASGATKELPEKEHLHDLLIHDLTGLLSVASATAANLLQKPDRYGPLSEQQRRMVDRILRNVEKAQTLLHEMMEISRSEEGLFKRELFPVERTLKESFIDALELIAPQAAEKLCRVEDQKEMQEILRPQGIFVEITGRYCNTPFCHDPRKVQQILRNLISNALKYRREQMFLSITGDMDLLILVEDDGLGIPPEEREAVFKRFFRLKDKRNTDVPGIGLGLTGVKALLVAMKGEIILENREGGGTRFMARIPPLQPH